MYANFYDSIENLNENIVNKLSTKELVNNNYIKETGIPFLSYLTDNSYKLIIINIDMIQNNILSRFMDLFITSMYEDIIAQTSFMTIFVIIWFVLYTSMTILFYIVVWRPTESKLEFDVYKLY